MKIKRKSFVCNFLHMKMKTPIFLYNPIKNVGDDSDMRPKFERGKHKLSGQFTLYFAHSLLRS